MKIAVLVSGGVDSSVALALLKEQGHDVTAFYLKIWLEDELSSLGECPWEHDLAYVRAVCDKLQVPLEVISLQREYWDHVVSYTIAEVKQGRTPNPDVFCNQKVKFGFFLEKISSDFTMVATGHYAQRYCQHGVYYLRQAPDAVKDQTYFLAYLSQEQLARVLFPIGHLSKPEVRALAHSFDLPNKDRKDSQGICFLGKFKFSDFIRHHIGDQAGDLVEIETGKKLGTHQGFWYYTIGQRQGLRLAGGPWYVVSKDPQCNRVYISRTYYATEKDRKHVVLDSLNWFEGHAPIGQIALSVKMRHGPHKHTGVSLATDLSGRVVLTLVNNDQGIAPGQFAVFYKDDICLGSGIISSSE